MFEERRDSLFRRVIDLKLSEDLTASYVKEFLEFVNDIIIDMLDGEADFFGNFMLKVERGVKLDIAWPIATMPKNSGFVMYFNPILFLQLTKKEMIALFKHEIYHIMYFHYERSNVLKNSYSSEVITIALDISINQYIEHLPPEAKRIDAINREFNIDLKENMTVEQYAEKLQDALKKKEKKIVEDIDNDSIVREIDIKRAHELWNESDLSKESIKGNTKKIAVSFAAKNTPDDLCNIIKGFNEKEELSWEQILKGLIPSVRTGYKKTITRRNRRQPDRLDLRGRLPNNKPEIIIAIDISASMSDEDIRKIMIEILAITSSRKGSITVIECDNEIRNIYNLNSIKDIKKRSGNNGSTAFSPIFEYIKDNRMKDSILIYFTDGVGEEELKIKPSIKNIIWVLIGEEEFSLKDNYGIIKRIKSSIHKGEGKGAAIEMVKSVIHDWAR